MLSLAEIGAGREVVEPYEFQHGKWRVLHRLPLGLRVSHGGKHLLLAKHLGLQLKQFEALALQILCNFAACLVLVVLEPFVTDFGRFVGDIFCGFDLHLMEKLRLFLLRIGPGGEDGGGSVARLFLGAIRLRLPG